MIERAAEAEAAVLGRHLGLLWALPGTRLGRDAWPQAMRHRMHAGWNYWWQAHLLDCLVDAQLRAPTPRRAGLVRGLARGVWLRNRMRWINNYYDDMAWLALALHRAAAVTGMNTRRAVRRLSAELWSAWSTTEGGGIRWRRGTEYKNAPANGPAAILHARLGERDRAAAIAEWMTERLVDPRTGLVFDGLAIYRDGRPAKLSRRIYTYCQGVYLGACVELWSAQEPKWCDRAVRTIDAVAEHLAPGGVLRGEGGGDGGLFPGILARYLADAAIRLPGEAAGTAANLVRTSAEACWHNAARVHGRPLFGPDWSQPLRIPFSETARDLTVQLSGWMLLEAAARLDRAAR